LASSNVVAAGAVANVQAKHEEEGMSVVKASLLQQAYISQLVNCYSLLLLSQLQQAEGIIEKQVQRCIQNQRLLDDASCQPFTSHTI
jgi:hypothetical protein